MHYTPAFALKRKQGKRITMFIFVSKEIQEILEGCTQTGGGEQRDRREDFTVRLFISFKVLNHVNTLPIQSINFQPPKAISLVLKTFQE